MDSIIKEVPGFGLYADFPKGGLEDEEARKLCYQSLSGTTKDVASFAAYQIRNKYAYIKDEWYKYNDLYWYSTGGPDLFLTEEMMPLYRKLMKCFFIEEKQKERLYSIVERLGEPELRQPFITEMQVIFTEKYMKGVDFSCKKNLVPFKNGVFDTKECEFREHQREDYITGCYAYDLPDMSDPAFWEYLPILYPETDPTFWKNFFILCPEAKDVLPLNGPHNY